MNGFDLVVISGAHTIENIKKDISELTAMVIILTSSYKNDFLKNYPCSEQLIIWYQYYNQFLWVLMMLKSNWFWSDLRKSLRYSI